MATKILENVEVMSTGVWDANRPDQPPINVQRYHLEGAVRAFKGRPEGERVTIKVGHTSKEFNQRLADALAIPVDTLAGEGEKGEGAVDLGHITDLRREGDKVLAKLEDVPEGLADMVERKLYNGVSPEAAIRTEGDDLIEINLKALSLLGRQDPAIKDLAPLENSMMYAMFSYVPEDLAETDDPPVDNPSQTVYDIKDENSLFQRFKQWFQREEKPNEEPEVEDMDMDKIREALALDAEVSEEDIFVAISALREKADATETPEEPTETPPEFIAEGSELEKVLAGAFAKWNEETVAPLVKQVAELNEQLTKAKGESRVAHYSAIAQGWNAIPGTPEEYGTMLAKIEEAQGQETADQFVAMYSKQQAQAFALGRTSAIGSQVTQLEESDPMEAKIDAYAKEHETDRNQAMAHFARTEPEAFNDYHQRVLDANFAGR